jgi:hypothetical protein
VPCVKCSCDLCVCSASAEPIWQSKNGRATPLSQIDRGYLKNLIRFVQGIGETLPEADPMNGRPLAEWSLIFRTEMTRRDDITIAPTAAEVEAEMPNAPIVYTRAVCSCGWTSSINGNEMRCPDCNDTVQSGRQTAAENLDALVSGVLLSLRTAEATLMAKRRRRHGTPRGRGGPSPRVQRFLTQQQERGQQVHREAERIASAIGWPVYFSDDIQRRQAQAEMFDEMLRTMRPTDTFNGTFNIPKAEPDQCPYVFRSSLARCVLQLHGNHVLHTADPAKKPSKVPAKPPSDEDEDGWLKRIKLLEID